MLQHDELLRYGKFCGCTNYLPLGLKNISPLPHTLVLASPLFCFYGPVPNRRLFNKSKQLHSIRTGNTGSPAIDEGFFKVYNSRGGSGDSEAESSANI